LKYIKAIITSNEFSVPVIHNYTSIVPIPIFYLSEKANVDEKLELLKTISTKSKKQLMKISGPYEGYVKRHLIIFQINLKSKVYVYH